MRSVNVKLIISFILALIVLAEAFPWSIGESTEREVLCIDPGQISNGIRSPAEGVHSVGSEVHFQCVAGYTINGTANLTCMSDGQWNESPPVCQVHSLGNSSKPKIFFPVNATEEVVCKEPGQIRNGRLNTTNTTYNAGSTIIYQCLPGFEIQGEASLTCTHNGTWSHDMPECKRIKAVCRHPGEVINGGQSITRNSYSVGSRIRYHCYPGYKIDGKASIICRKNGKWSHKVPLCKRRALRCKDPGRIRYGKRSVQIKRTHRAGSTILYRCNPGYKVNGTASITCKSNGNWSNDIPTCQPISCGKPFPTKHGNFTGNEFTYRSIVTYECDVGYKLIGKPQRRCRSNGKWTKKPKCQIHKCRVKGTLRIRYGTIKTTDKTYSHGATLLFKCTKGYELVGTDSIACLEGKWSARRLPYCKVKACPNPGFPENGRRIGNNFRIGHSVRFTCQSGFKLTGSPVRKCLPNKQWSGSVAVCDDGSTDCPILGTPISGIKIGNRYSFGSVVRFECKEGYILQGSSIRRCTFKGSWNGTEAKCVDEFHYFVKNLNDTAIMFRKNIDTLMEYTCSSGNSTCNISGIDTRARSIDLGKHGGLDVLFVFDASSSIKKKEFKLAKDFAIKIVNQIGATWKPKGTRIATIVYGTKPELVFNLGDHGATSAQGVIKKLRKVKRLGGGTATTHALEMARKLVFVTEKTKRQRAMFFITDGRSNIGGKPEEAARILRERYNVQITAIGVGKEVKLRELYSIGENKDDVIVVKDYKQLKKAIDQSVKIDYSECGVGVDTRARMVGGIRANQKRWPWQVGLHSIDIDLKSKLFCGGALIDERWVLTAAHCFDRHSRPEEWTVKAGDYFLDEDDPSEQVVQVEEIFLHNHYIAKADFENDIALVKLLNKVKLGPFVRTVCLPKMNEELLEPGNVGFVAGWGHTKAYRPGPVHQKIIRSKILLESAFSVQSNELCDNKTKYYFNSTVTFCAGDGKGGNDTCKGDSGGSFVRPVVLDGKLRWVTAGLVSWGEGCGWKDKYGYYTRVAPFAAWIKKTIKDNKTKN